MTGAMRLAGRVAVITGAASGIGERIARQFAAEGARVAILDIDGPGAQAVAADLDGAVATRADVSSREQIAAAVDYARDRLGPIDLVVNNAATCSDTPFDVLPDDEWCRDVTVDLTAAYRLVQLTLEDLVAHSGVVVNIASVNGLAHYGNEAYSAAKAGLISLTRSLAVTLGPRGVRVNAIAPGTVVTPIWDERLARDPGVLDGATRWYPLARLGTPQDIANAAVFLASPEASWISGTTLVVDGGLSAGNAVMSAEIVVAE